MTAGRGQYNGAPSNAEYNRRQASGGYDGRHGSTMFSTRGEYFARDYRRDSANENDMDSSLLCSDVCNNNIVNDKSRSTY